MQRYMLQTNCVPARDRARACVIPLFAHTTCTAVRTNDFRTPQQPQHTDSGRETRCSYNMRSDWILPLAPAGAPVTDMMQELFSPAIRMLQDLSQGIASRRELNPISGWMLVYACMHACMCQVSTTNSRHTGSRSHAGFTFQTWTQTTIERIYKQTNKHLPPS